MIVMFLASSIIWLRRKHDYRSGAFLLVLYATVYVVLIAGP
jgi:hypothetical protein